MARVSLIGRCGPKLLVLWAGMALGVAFLATPAKFLAPSLSLPVALDVGRHTFQLSNRVEIAVLAALIGAGLWSGARRSWYLALVIPGAVVLAQALWLLPALDRRAVAIIAGGTPPPSNLHVVYILLEMIKIVALLLSTLALERRSAAPLRPAAPGAGVSLAALALGLLTLAPAPARAALPPVPVPAENPITEPKRVLGKILFWDEQMSSDNTVACGTCHRPGKGGGDPRSGASPGKDGVFGTDDDTFGSPGEPHMDKRGLAVAHKLFGMKPQVGDRTAPSYFGNIWAPSLFWDGRAGPTVIDPDTGKVVIKTGGALENQALGPLQNPAEMAKTDRGWADLTTKLRVARPLALATRIPHDMAAALKVNPRYPALFKAAFGDPQISVVRVAMALATYERTLVPDQTPYDLGTQPGKPIDPAIQQGMLWMDTAHCTVCHKPPLFTDNKFHNIGVRRPFQDPGREKVTGNPHDAGAMKTPTLRNVGLRASFMHTGEFHDLYKVLDHYVTPKAEADPLPGTNEPYRTTIDDSARAPMIDFMTNALTDPRVAAETYPFDRPTLRSERAAGKGPPPRPAKFKARFTGPGEVTLDWTPSAGAADYVLIRDGAVIGLPTAAPFTDTGVNRWLRHRYSLVARNEAAASSRAVGAGAGVPSLELAGGGVVLAGAGAVYAFVKRRRG